MLSSELLKKVRKIEIKARGISRNIFAGEYHSAFKGRGMAFSEVRAYQPGDDVRAIDWKVTARYNQPFVKLFEEERELKIILMVDVSGSQEFGTTHQLKQDMITEIAAILAFSAIQNNDNIGIIFFSDIIENYIPPKKGRSQVLRIIRDLIEFQPKNRRTNISNALKFVSNVIKKRSIIFVISDFMDDGFENAIKEVKSKHDLIGLKIYDQRETTLPPLGLVKFKDAETGQNIWIDATDKKVRKNFEEWWRQSDKKLKELFHKCGVDYVKVRTDQSYIPPLMNLFKKRELK
ncbi:DUF58 domain-containing protein [soil metagenome]